MNKKEICEALVPILQSTRAFDDLVDIFYLNDETNGEEFVCMIFENNYTKQINVTCDSKIAMIGQIVNSY
jgi:hypothetical protein